MSDVAKKRLLLVAGAICAAGVVIAIVLFATSGGGPTDAPSGGQVKLELRGKPVASIRMNGKQIGTTPTTIVVARGSTPIELEATFMLEKYGMRKPAKKVEIWRQVKTVVPDAEQSVDFRIEDATKVEENVETATP